MQTITEIIKPISLLKGRHEDTAQTGSGWSAVTVNGWELTHLGRLAYCMSCEAPE